MTTAIATLITCAPRRIGDLRKAVSLPYRPTGLAAFDSENRLIAQYSRDTMLDVALASAKYADSGSHEDLVAILKLEARDGNEDARKSLGHREAM
jgi:hypothetical protein